MNTTYWPLSLMSVTISADVDDRRAAVADALLAIVGDADPRRGQGEQVAHEDVNRVVGVAGDEVRRLRLEGDEVPVGRQHASAVHAVRGHSPEGGRSRG